MISMIFTVWDSAAERFLEPFFAPTVEYALRSFRQAVNEPGHQFNRFPADYTLFKIGEYDAETGDVAGHSPQSLGVAITMVEKARAPEHGDQLELIRQGANGDG